MLSCESPAGGTSADRFALPCRLAPRPSSCDDPAERRHNQNAPPAATMIMPPRTYQKALLRALPVSSGEVLADGAGAGAGSPASRGATPSPTTENLTCSCAATFLTKNTASPDSSE